MDPETAAFRQEALGVAQRLKSQLPDSPGPMLVEGLVHYRHGDSQAAVKCWERCVETHPAFADAYYWLGQEALHRGDYEEAARSLDMVLRFQPYRTDAYLPMAEAFMG
ncbi:MAG: tetratricopeptide repeat protein, partial [Planctomycetota bacterium]